MRNYLYFLLFTLALLSGCDQSSTTPPRLLINEVMARNETITCFERDGPDWVEIYNADDRPLRLEGYTLSDNIDRPKKYRFPAALWLPAGEFLVVTLAGPDQDDAFYEYDPAMPFQLRADFALNDDRDTVFLFAAGRQIDRMVVRNLDADTTVGRYPDGGASIGRSFAPTPERPNNDHGTLRPLFAAGGGPQPSLCTSETDPVSVSFTVLTDPDFPLPQVTLDYITRESCVRADQDPVVCRALFEEAAVVGSAELTVEEISCQGGVGELDPQCPQETTDGSYGNQPVRVLTYEALLPSAAEMGAGTTILWNLRIVDDLGELCECRCLTFGGDCVTLVINEYQARNIDTLKFVCETCVDNQSVRTPDWIEVHNYGDDPIDISEFGLVGRNAARDNNLSTWMFGRDTDGAPDPGYLLVQPGECRLVLADGDGGDVRRVYRMLVRDEAGNLVPDLTRKFYSTRFALNPNRRSGSDEFALTAPAGSFQVIIDRAVLDFSAYAAANPDVNLDDDEFFLRDLSAARFPDEDVPDAQTLQERFAPEVLSPGRVTDCPSPPATFDDLGACINRIVCEKPPRFIEEVAVSPDIPAAEGVGRRCPRVDEAAKVMAYVAIDATASAARESQGAGAFTVLLDYLHEDGSAGTLDEDTGLLVREAEGRSADTPPGMMLWEIEAVIPPQAAGLVSFALTVIDRLQQLSVAFDEENAPRADPESAPQVSFSYLSGGISGVSLRLSEIMPDNESVELPGFEGFPADRSPNYIEVHLPGDSEMESYDLSGHYLAVEPAPGDSLGRARAFALPEGMDPVVRGDYLLLALGLVPEGELPVPVVGLEGFALDSCSSTLYLVAPDELGNCVVDRISWSCPADFQGGDITADLAYGIPCEAIGESMLVTPTPGADNGLEPFFFSAFHTEAGSDDPNPCVAPGSFPVLAAIFFLDEALVSAMGASSVSGVDFGISGAMALGSSSTVLLGETVDAPPGYSAVRVSQPLLLNGGPDVTRVEYSVSLQDACGSIASSCDGGGRCFSLGVGSAGLPAISINEANRNFTLPGSGGEARPWLELYNDSAVTVDLGGMSLSADPSDPRSVAIPADTILPAGSSLVVLTDGGAPLDGAGAPPHLVVDLDWITMRFFCLDPNAPCDSVEGADWFRRTCGFDPDSPEDSAPPVRIFLVDKVERGSCLLDVFGFEFPNPDCSDGTSIGRFPDGGGDIMVLAEPTPGSGVEPVTFIRGDADANGEVDMTDVNLILNVGQGDPPSCMDRFDANDNGAVNFIDDGIFLLTFLNSGGPPPPPPFPEEGVDPTPDSLPCTR
mgnify:CR=1 FL=1